MKIHRNESRSLPPPGHIARIAVTLIGLWLGASAWAQTGAPEPTPAPEADMQAMRAELDRARAQITEAARRMARIQRQLGDTEEHTRIIMRTHEDHEQEFSEQLETMELRLREQLGGMRPRLGVLLGGPDSADEQDPRIIVGVTPGGGAEAAGVQRGDVLLTINGTEISSAGVASVRDALADAEPGMTVPVQVLRGDQTLDFDVELGSPGQDIQMIVRRLGDAPHITVHGPGTDIDVESVLEIVGDMPFPPIPPKPPGAHMPHLAALGNDIDLVSNHQGLESYFGTGDGVLVLRVEGDNAFGLRDGDVILTLDREPVSSPVSLGRLLLNRDAGSEVTLEVMRGGVLTELSGTVPEHSRFGRHLRKGLSRTEAPRAPKPPKAPPVTL